MGYPLWPSILFQEIIVVPSLRASFRNGIIQEKFKDLPDP